MKPWGFDYLRAENAEHALQVLEQYGERARVLAGGQSLMAVLNMRLAQPELLLDISRAGDLDTIQLENRQLVIGAAATQGKLEWRTTLADEVPLLRQALPFISHFQIRNRGTVCGSIAHADPSAELPLVLLALGGEVSLRSHRRQRVLPAEAFFQGMLSTARAPDELIEAVRFPLKRAGERYGFAEFAARHGDFAVVACAAVVTDTSIRLAVGGVADRPMLETWPKSSAAELQSALNDFSWKLKAEDDPLVSAGFRRHLVRQLGMRAIEEAV